MQTFKRTGKKYLALLIVLMIVFGMMPNVTFAVAATDTLINASFESPNFDWGNWWANFNPTVGDMPTFGWNTTSVSTPKFEFGGDWNVGAWGIGFIPDGTQFIELNANERASVYQDINTTPGEVIYWSLYQGGVWYSSSQNIDNTMAVRIGTPTELPDLTMSSETITPFDQSWTNRVIYKLNEMQVVDSLPAAYNGKDANKKQLYTEPKRWTKYEGVYVVPEGQTVTRFAFASLSAVATQGNLLDNVVFRTATQEEINALDHTKPVIDTPSGNPTVWTLGGVNIAFTVTDNESGLASVQVSGDQSGVKTVLQSGNTYSFTADQNENFTVTAVDNANNIETTTIAVTRVIDAIKLAEAKNAVELALNALAVTNETTAEAFMSAATSAALYGATVAWDETLVYTKTNATRSAAGSITGTINLTLYDTVQPISINKSITQLPATGRAPTPDPEPIPVVDKPVLVIVNGKTENAGKEANTILDGKTIVTVTVNNAIVEERINEALKNNNLDADNLFQIRVTDTKSDVVNVQLTGDIIKKLETNTIDVSIKRDNVEYVIPAEEFTISNVAKNLGVSETSLKAINVEVRFSKPDEKTIEKYNQVVNNNGAELVFSPVSFEVVASATQPDGTVKEVEINKFSSYVERIMAIPPGVDPSKITTGIVFNADGTYSHVPTELFLLDGKWYAKLNSLTNSEYSVIWNQVTVKSVDKHWAKEAVNDLASRLVIMNTESFEPNKAITRADFAEYLVRALGLYREGLTFEKSFSDVSEKSSKYLGILIANDYGILSGYSDGTFRPYASITREEAMAMYQKAMHIVALQGSDSNRYMNFDDFNTVGKWAETSVKEVLSAHVFNGTAEKSISPKANLTYAEAAQAIKNLLVASKLIN